MEAVYKVLKVKNLSFDKGHTGFRTRLLIGGMALYTAPFGSALKAVAPLQDQFNSVFLLAIYGKPCALANHHSCATLSAHR